MTADNPSPFVPKLRFPEFRDDPPWSAPLLADLYEFKRTNTLSRDKLNYVTGTIRNIHYGDIHTKFNPLFQVREEHVPYVNPDSSAKGIDADAFCKEGDIVLADASEDLNDVGKAIEVVSLDGERVVAGTHTILGTRRGNVPVVGFGGQLFQSPAVRARIKKEAQGAKVYGISAKRISAVPIPIPPTVAEQQKIADCLGSLDDVIAAEGRKLEALRQHKQGLIQLLFPQPGAAVPRLRFPEFRDAPEWSTPRGDTLFDSINNRRATPGLPVLAITQEHGAIPRDQIDYHVSVTAKSVASYKEVCEGDFIISLRSFQGGIEHSRYHGICSPAYVILRRKGGGNDHFFRHLFKSDRFIQQLTRNIEGIRDGKMISYAQFSEQQLPVPEPPEQQKIADCLTSIDDQLNAQARRIDALKQHKQGLQQQLFPSLEGQ